MNVRTKGRVWVGGHMVSGFISVVSEKLRAINYGFCLSTASTDIYIFDHVFLILMLR